MRVKSLKLTNVRAIKAAEFRFQPRFNLIVGVNGVGKTSVLDSLCVCLSAFVKQANKLRTSVRHFAIEDIRVGANALTIECVGNIHSSDYHYLIHKPCETSVPQKKQVGMPRKQVHDTPEKALFLETAPMPVTGREPGGRPLAVLFSTKRAVPSERAPRKSAVPGGIEAAFADAFTERELRLREFGAWLRVQESMRSERPEAGCILDACEEAVKRFLPGYTNLRMGSEDNPQILIDRDSTTIPVRQLSDGERGILALVLDLTRRLAQANPDLTDPASEAEAVVLIDEIDLHLHPQWQRQVVHKLTETFPGCQFIATTHSPQVIGEVRHDCIHIISDGQVYSPTHSFGVDSSRVLEEIMNVYPRTKEVEELLTEVSREVGKQQYENAHELLVQLVKRLGENDPEVTRIRTLLDFMEGEE